MPFIEEAVMFGKKRKDTVRKSYDSARQEPVIISSICNGERVAGFRDIHSKKVEEVMCIRSPKDLEEFAAIYGIRLEDIKRDW